jgi:phosphomannomutase
MADPFLAYDIRGVYGRTITGGFVEKVGKAIGSIFNGDGLLTVGYDVRYSSPSLEKRVNEGILSTGCDILSIGKVPGPVAYFCTMNSKSDAGVYITASHNPPEYNGIKFIRNNGTSFTHELITIKKLVNSNKYIKKTKGTIKNIDNSITLYNKYLEKKVKKMNNLVIAIDSLHGSVGLLHHSFFLDFGISIEKAFNLQPLGDFGGAQPVPTPENLKKLISEVVKKNLDFGVSFDGDGDRAVFVDNKGRVLNGGIVSSLFIKDFLKNSHKQESVIASIDLPSNIIKSVKKYNGNLIWSKVGHTYIEEKMIEEGAIFGGEQSSHYYFGEIYPFSDGILATLMLSAILSRENMKLSTLVDSLKINPTNKIYIKFNSHNKKNEVMSKIKDIFLKECTNVDTTDGIKLYLNDIEWVLVRASNTMPAINLSIEAKNINNLKKIQNKYEEIIKGYQ